MHGAGRVGGNEFYHDLLRMFGLGAAIVRAFSHGGAHRVLIPGSAVGEVDEAGACDFDPVEAGPVQIHVPDQRFRDSARRHAHGLGALHGDGGRPVAVCRVLRGLHRNGGKLRLRQFARRRGPVIRRRNDGSRLLPRIFHVIHLFPHSVCSFFPAAGMAAMLK